MDNPKCKSPTRAEILTVLAGHGITENAAKVIARVTMSSVPAARVWLANDTACRHGGMPPGLFKLLQLELWMSANNIVQPDFK